jgi:uncharacterized membrane protein
MIREFIYKYYIDPIRYGGAYTIVDTLTYAVILIVSLYLIYRWLNRTGISIDRSFIYSLLPFVVLGSLLRVIQDTGMITSDLQFLLITPLIFFTIFFFTIACLFVSRLAEQHGLIRDYHTGFAGLGVVACLVSGAVLGWYGLTVTRIDFGVLLTILLMAATATTLVWAFLRYVLRWEFASDPIYVMLLLGHLFDASATSFGIDLHPLHYVEQHVVGSSLIAATGTGFVMFPLKLAVLIPGIYVLELYRKEGASAFWHLVVFAMIVVGMAPGLRDMLRMVLYV